MPIHRTTAQPREHAVPCVICRRPTWNVDAECDRHSEAPPKPRQAPRWVGASGRF